MDQIQYIFASQILVLRQPCKHYELASDICAKQLFFALRHGKDDFCCAYLIFCLNGWLEIRKGWLKRMFSP